jgi:uncharacterized membrane protein
LLIYPEFNKGTGGMSMTTPSQGTGLQENVASLLCYLLGWVTGVIFLIIEPNNKTVKFHAIQSIIVFGALSIIMLIFGWIPFLGWFIILPLSWLLWFVSWIVLMVKAYQGGTWKYPIVGNYAEKYVK